MNKKQSFSYDAIVVLGGGRTKKGLTDLSKLRLDRGIELYREGKAEKIFALGGHYSTYLPGASYFKRPGCFLRREYLVKEGGVPAKDIVLADGDSRDTIGEAFACRKKAKRFGLKNFLLVTSTEHLPRASFTFRRIFGPGYKIIGVKVSTGASILEQEEREYFFRVTKPFFKKLPAMIFNSKNWYRDHPDLYRNMKKIHGHFHATENAASGAYCLK